MVMPLPPSMTQPSPNGGGGIEDIPFIGGALADALGGLGRLLLVIVATGALVSLAVILITAGLLNLLGFKSGDVARLTPPGRAATIAEVAVGAAQKG